MRKTEINNKLSDESRVQRTEKTVDNNSASEIETNLSCLSQAAGRLCEVAASACKNRAQFKEAAEKGKRTKTDVKAVKEMCAVLKELTLIVRGFGADTENTDAQPNVLEVIFEDSGDKYAQ